MLAWVATAAVAGDLFVARRGTIVPVTVRVDSAQVLVLDGAAAPVVLVPDGLRELAVLAPSGGVVCSGRVDLSGAVRVTVTPEGCSLSAQHDGQSRLPSGPAAAELGTGTAMQFRADGAELSAVLRVDEDDLGLDSEALRYDPTPPAPPSVPVGELRVDRSAYSGELWVTVDGATQLAPNGWKGTVAADAHTVTIGANNNGPALCTGTVRVAAGAEVVVRIGADGRCTGL